MNTTTSDSTAEALRGMVERITAGPHFPCGPAVEAAMRAVPRHRFVPEASLTEAYSDIAVITQRGVCGEPLSCVPVPGVVAMMLTQLDVHPGQRVLEIGAGSGYNAALLAHLVGEHGRVTTLDIEPEITAAAQLALDRCGYGQAEAITRDGALGAAEYAPFDRIVVTCAAWDLPPAWVEQLAEDGRLVVPLRWRGQTRSVAWRRDGHALRSEDSRVCGFLPMIGQAVERMAYLDAGRRVALYYDLDQQVDLSELGRVLQRLKTTCWSGVTLGPGELFDGLWLNLTTHPGTCRITASPAAVATGLCAPFTADGGPALVTTDSLAYLTARPLADDPQRRELGVISHGPAREPLADRFREYIHAWARDPLAQPALTAYDALTPIISRPHTRLVLSR